MRYTKLFFIALLMFFALPMLGQRHGALLELLGPGGYYSINYTYSVPIQNRLTLGTRLGISTHKLRDYRLNFNPNIRLPLGIWLSYGQKISWHIGLGTIINRQRTYHMHQKTQQRDNYLDYYGDMGISYQFHKLFQLKASYTPLLQTHNSISHWGSLSLQYCF